MEGVSANNAIQIVNNDKAIPFKPAVPVGDTGVTVGFSDNQDQILVSFNPYNQPGCNYSGSF